MSDVAPQKAYHHGNLRAALLEQAVLELQETSPEQLSLRAVARSLGVSQTAPYRHFSGKEDLLAAIAVRGYRQLLDELEAAKAQSGDSAAEQIREVARAYVKFAERRQQLFKLMFGPLVQPSVQPGAQPGSEDPELREVSRSTLLLVQSLLHQGISNGEFQAQDVVYLANAAWAGIHGVATLRIDAPGLFKKHIDLLRQIDVAVDTFLLGIKRQDT